MYNVSDHTPESAALHSLSPRLVFGEMLTCMICGKSAFCLFLPYWKWWASAALCTAAVQHQPLQCTGPHFQNCLLGFLFLSPIQQWRNELNRNTRTQISELALISAEVQKRNPKSATGPTSKTVQKLSLPFSNPTVLSHNMITLILKLAGLRRDWKGTKNTEHQY